MRRMDAGSAAPFFTLGFSPLDFAVDPAGTVCYEGEGWECRRQDDSVDFPSLQGPSLAFGPGGLMYVSTWDNVWKLEGVLQTPLITGVPVSGTLTVTANVFASETSASYAYNSRSELVQVMRHPVGEEAYSYDPAGNRMSDHRASDYVYNEVNQLTAGNGAVYTHDASGNRLSELRTLTSELTTYTWTSENRLRRIDFPDGRVAEYSYDPFGRRIQKKLTAPDGTETVRRFIYDREDILFELDGNGAVISEYLHGPGIDEPISMRKDGQTYYYHQDALGSIVAITDADKNLVQRYEYDAYGAITYVLDPDFKQPYAFTGREYDEESGLYYYRARYYDPKVGRFISKDPIGFAGGDVNLYGYVLNDPVNGVDPDGRIGVIGVTGAIATGIGLATRNVPLFAIGMGLIALDYYVSLREAEDTGNKLREKLQEKLVPKGKLQGRC